MAGFAQCAQCGFTTRSDQLPDQHFTDSFGEAYFQGNEYGDYLGDKDSAQVNFRRRLDAVLRYVDAPASRKLFEIGCAYGFFLELTREKFAAVRGIDISEPAIAYARETLGLDAQCGDYLQIDIAKGYDVFCTWDCIAHLERPDLYLEKVAADIAPNGVLAITTGDAGSLNARMRGRNWRIMKQPTIVHHFSRRNLTQLLERLGFTVVDISYPVIWRTLRAICRGVLGKDYMRNPLVRMLNSVGLLEMNVPLNLYDLMLVVAKKNDA